ncbi:acyl transferase/acyl hydrolase/lysophospholipase [Flagelloscypha sp. PMI_526]|nr:acyl transferase/acyl hydrolase/lysophospholipase [Flagelloscypha sp. PMI_526]
MRPVASLSLDGGAFLALSELFLLREIMTRLQTVLNLDSTPLPCDHFDVIGGSGSGGLLSLLLGRLRMSVDTAIEHFICLYKSLYEPNLDKCQRSNLLSETFKTLCQDQTMLEHNAACKIFVCAIPAASITGCKPELFRNYKARKYASFDCKIWQAARATTAYPSLFDAISIGLGWRSVAYLDPCAFGFSNPISLVVDEAKSLHPSTKEWLFLSLGAGHPGIFGVSSSGDECSSLLKRIAEDCERVAEKMDESGQNGYVRLNVAQGFQGFKPHELTDPGIIATHTRHYAAMATIDRHLDAIVDFLANRHRQSSDSSTSLSLIQHLDRLISRLPDVDPWDFELDDELIVRRNYRFYTGRIHAERRVVVQVFEGDYSQKYRDMTLYANIILKHPNLLVVFRKSGTNLTGPCIFFSNGPLLPANTQLSLALNNSKIGNLVFQGISLIKDLAVWFVRVHIRK